MLIQVLIFVTALAVLLVAARFFTGSAETIGRWLRMPEFVVGVFIVGIGTSLPELISGILAVRQQASEIVPGNIIGSGISNLLLVTGLAVAINRKPITLGSTYMFIDLHFLVGATALFALLAYDGKIMAGEAAFGLITFIIYSIYLIRGGSSETADLNAEPKQPRPAFPVKALLLLLASAAGIFFGADYTISSISAIAEDLDVPKSIIALTVLSLGTTLPELAVNISAIRKGKAEMAIGNVLGSCIFNLLVIPAVASAFGTIDVPAALLRFSLPVMAGAALFFYLLAQDKKISPWEGLLFVVLYALVILKIAGIS